MCACVCVCVCVCTQDCHMSLKADAVNAKSMYRKGLAYFGLRQYKQALKALKALLKLLDSPAYVSRCVCVCVRVCVCERERERERVSVSVI